MEMTTFLGVLLAAAVFVIIMLIVGEIPALKKQLRERDESLKTANSQISEYKEQLRGRDESLKTANSQISNISKRSDFFENDLKELLEVINEGNITQIQGRAADSQDALIQYEK